jgi:hypothetical protein
MKKTTIRLAALAFVAALSSGCITKGIAPDELPVLAADEGLVGVQMDSLDKISQIQFTPSGAGKTLYISGIDPGMTTHVFKAKAGEYCVYQIHFGDWRITWDERNLCFEVVPGKLVFGGVFAPRVIRGRTNMQQTVGNFEVFANVVRQQYPALAAEYLPK